MTNVESRFVSHELAVLSCGKLDSPKKNRNSTCRLCWALICTFCCQAGWRRSSTGLCTGHCSRSHTPLQVPPVRYHRWADRTLKDGEQKKKKRKTLGSQNYTLKKEVKQWLPSRIRCGWRHVWVLHLSHPKFVLRVGRFESGTSHSSLTSAPPPPFMVFF